MTGAYKCDIDNHRQSFLAVAACAGLSLTDQTVSVLYVTGRGNRPVRVEADNERHTEWRHTKGVNVTLTLWSACAAKTNFPLHSYAISKTLDMRPVDQTAAIPVARRRVIEGLTDHIAAVDDRTAAAPTASIAAISVPDPLPLALPVLPEAADVLAATAALYNAEDRALMTSAVAGAGEQQLDQQLCLQELDQLEHVESSTFEAVRLCELFSSSAGACCHHDAELSSDPMSSTFRVCSTPELEQTPPGFQPRCMLQAVQ
jgi:hypothetical protein